MNGNDELTKEVVMIRKLMVFALLRSGASQAEIAAALGMDQSQISRMFPKKIAKPRRQNK